MNDIIQSLITDHDEELVQVFYTNHTQYKRYYHIVESHVRIHRKKATTLHHIITWEREQ